MRTAFGVLLLWAVTATFLLARRANITERWLRGRTPAAGEMPLPYAFIPSPNQDDRSPGATVNAVVLHATVLTTTRRTVEAFLDPRTHVSAHFVVGKDGRVVQMVRVERRAWHAGISEMDGLPHVNDYSVGIEMVNKNDGHDPYPEPQVESVAGIIRLLRARYRIPDSRVVSHFAVALPAGRKSDPRGFNFAHVLKLADSEPR